MFYFQLNFHKKDIMTQRVEPSLITTETPQAQVSCEKHWTGLLKTQISLFETFPRCNEGLLTLAKTGSVDLKKIYMIFSCISRELFTLLYAEIESVSSVKQGLNETE